MTMNSVGSKVAVVGSGISGAVCASSLARNGVSVTIFESARGPGGRMSRRREVTEDGKELLFDHGAPFFSVSNAQVLSLVREWESRGLVAEWSENFGAFDCISHDFVDIQQLHHTLLQPAFEVGMSVLRRADCLLCQGLLLNWSSLFSILQERLTKKYVGVPGMNAICRALCQEPGVESKFGVGVGKFEWLEEEKLWSLMGLDGENLGRFQGVIASDKNIVSPRITNVTGRPPPLGLNIVPEWAVKLQDIPAMPCFALMLAFAEPLSAIPTKGFRIINSEVLSWAYCDSSKPGRSTISERWVLHSTTDYANGVIAQAGLLKPSEATLTKVAEELFHEFQSTGLISSQPFFKRAHRWGSAFPVASIAREEKCLWEKNKRLAICGDFCVGPNIEGAIVSGMAAASKLSSCL